MRSLRAISEPIVTLLAILATAFAIVYVLTHADTSGYVGPALVPVKASP